ncbi:MAG: dihydroorotate dehydrogenase-like protein [Pirellulales bacterium]
MAADTTTRYLGLKLANPLVVSACPLTGELDVLRRLEEYGAAAAVLPSLFEEQVQQVAVATHQTAGQPTAVVENISYFHELREYNRGPDAYLKHVAAAKQAVSIPIIGSLNATAPGNWINYARRIEAAGADALELNLYFIATDFDTSSRDLEARYVSLVSAVRHEISIPLAVKICPYFTALPQLARRLVEAGADGLVLFNRFLQPDVDLDHMRCLPKLALSTPEEVRLPLRWIGLLHGRLDASLAASTGAHFADDVVKLLLVGADVVMVASTLYRNGVEGLRTLVGGVQYWLDSNDFQSLDQARGTLSQRKCPDPAAYERANYTRALSSFVTGVGNNAG